MPKPILILVGVIILVGLGAYVIQKRVLAQNSNKRQAVFLDNGQVYFGILSDQTNEYVKLEDIYYLHAQDPLQVGSNTEKKKFSVVKLGDELHGPEDMMFINKEKILFYENMKESSKISEAIKKYIEQKEARSAAPAESVSPEPIPSPSA